MLIENRPISCLALAVIALGNIGYSQESKQKKEAAIPVPALGNAKARVRAANAASAISSSPIAEVVAKNFVLDPGKYLDFFANSDFTGADRVSIGIHADPTVDLSKSRVLVWWLIPSADWYVVQDAIRGDGLYFLNTGGANVPVYGTKLLLRVVNDGTQQIAIQQISVFANAR